jgi:hypothetical protein
MTSHAGLFSIRSAWDRRNGPPGLMASHSLRQGPGCRFASTHGSGR